VAFALVSDNDQDHMRRFLGSLKNAGLLPQVVITDGSNLYPTLLPDLWPAARHQLCVFHVMQDLNELVLDAVKRLRRQRARRGNCGRPRKSGRPRRGVRKRHRLTLKDKTLFVFKHRHLIVKRRADMSRQEGNDLVTMCAYLPELLVLRRFVDRVQRLFELHQSKHQAWCRRAALLREASFAAVPELARALKLLQAEKFAKMVAFVHSPVGQRRRTNNHVERTNRRLRYLEKVRYKWRRRRTLVRFLVLVFWHWRSQDHPENGAQTSTPEVGTSTAGSASRHRTRPAA
jgi:transposase-like protein